MRYWLIFLLCVFNLNAQEFDEPPSAEIEAQVEGEIELPSFGSTDTQYEHFEVGLWPDKMLLQMEIEQVEARLKDMAIEGEEYPGDRKQLSEAFIKMLFAHPKAEWYVPEMSYDIHTPPKDIVTIPPSDWHMIADCGKRTMEVIHKGKKVATFKGLEYSRKGFGDTLDSLKTPLGQWTVTKEPEHKYGLVFRLSGYQGINRGILIHRDNTRDGGSNGCLHLPSSDMTKLFNMVPEGAKLTIQK